MFLCLSTFTFVKEIVHSKAILFTISKNKAGFKMTGVMNIILTKELENQPQTECAMICTMIMQHLLSQDQKVKTMLQLQKPSRRLDLWIKCKFDNLFIEAKALQERLRKLN